MPNNQQAVEQTKRDCRYDEQIHRGDAVGMIAKERPPALGWRVSSLGHVLGHVGLSDLIVGIASICVMGPILWHASARDNRPSLASLALPLEERPYAAIMLRLDRQFMSWVKS